MTPLDLYERGFSVIPCHYGTKRPAVDWRRYQSERATVARVGSWFYPGRHTNAAVVCGLNGLVVIDFDTEHSYGAWLEWAFDANEVSYEVACNTYRVQTARGVHLYIEMAQPPRCTKFDGGDVKAQGGYVLIPPSLHPSGTHYTELNDGAPIVRVDDLQCILPQQIEPPKVVTPKPQTGSLSSLYPKPTVERIKDALNILDFFPDARPSGGNGRWYITRCLWHDDKSPSLRLDSANNMAYCWAGCTGDRGLDVIGVYAKIEGVDIKEAISRLKSMV